MPLLSRVGSIALYDLQMGKLNEVIRAFPFVWQLLVSFLSFSVHFLFDNPKWANLSHRIFLITLVFFLSFLVVTCCAGTRCAVPCSVMLCPVGLQANWRYVIWPSTPLPSSGIDFNPVVMKQMVEQVGGCPPPRRVTLLFFYWSLAAAAADMQTYASIEQTNQAIRNKQISSTIFPPCRLGRR